MSPRKAKKAAPAPIAPNRTRKELEDCRDDASAMAAHGNSNYPGMSYEEGVRDALDWALGDSDEHPMHDE